MTATITIELAALDLLEVDGYMKRYYAIMSEQRCKQRRAFLLVEEEYRAAFRKGKYADFKSFCRSRRRWYQSKRK